MLRNLREIKFDSCVHIISTDNMPQDPCATDVYKICSKEFTDEMRKHPGYNTAELCGVFKEGGTCIYDTAPNFKCDSSQILMRFKANSGSARWGVVLNAICSSENGK